MIPYPQIDPVALAVGPLRIHWYGLMYVVGLAAAWWLGRRRAHRLGLTHDDIGDLIFYAALGIILGGRLGYVLVYGLETWPSWRSGAMCKPPCWQRCSSRSLVSARYGRRP